MLGHGQRAGRLRLLVRLHLLLSLVKHNYNGIQSPPASTLNTVLYGVVGNLMYDDACMKEERNV